MQPFNENEEYDDQPAFSNGGSSNTHRPLPSTSKICIGDKVKITTKNGKLTQEKGTVEYIGYPFPGQHAQYGINLKSAKGQNDGSLYVDLKTGKVVRKNRKRAKKRKFFKVEKKHGVFVELDEIVAIDRQAPTADRFGIDDQVEVKFRGVGQIRFIGNLEHIKQMGVWYGIQLKDRSGRHDGTVNGVKYFECAPQYGLHCRCNHLTLLKASSSLSDLAQNPHSLDDGTVRSLQALQTVNRMSISDKPQRSKKWEKLLGTNEVKGFKARPAVPASAHNVFGQRAPKLPLPGLQSLHAPQTSLSHSLSDAADESDVGATSGSGSGRGTFRLVSISNLNHTKSRPTMPHQMASLSNLLPPNAFQTQMSVNVLPGTGSKNANRTVESSQSYKRGNTLAVLPGYYEHVKERKFFDHFHFDEIEDELGEGEFGVVYKCRRVKTEEDDDDDDDRYDFSRTMQTQYSSEEEEDEVEDEEEEEYEDEESKDEDDEEDDDEVFAVKKIKKAKFHHVGHRDKNKQIEMLQNEIRLLEKVRDLKTRGVDGSQYVMDLIDVFEDRNFLYIVTRFFGGGSLWKTIENAALRQDSSSVAAAADEEKSHDARHIQNEQDIQRIMQQILQGLAFLHEQDVAHLDIKPDNIMFTETGEIRLIDFGVSRVIPALQKRGVITGTPNFVAPEVIEGGYDKKADVWSVGVILFMLRFGHPPFWQDSSLAANNNNSNTEEAESEHDALFALIRKGFEPVTKPGLGPWFPQGIPVSDSLKDLISKMLVKDLARRLTASECLAHEYFATVADCKKLPPTIMDALRKFNGQCQFRVMIAKLFVHQIDQHQMKQLKETWSKFDTSGEGTLTLEQFKQVMSEYDHGFKDYQIDAIFESLDWNEKQSINFDSLLTAFSYQRLVCVDERLWDAFARLDSDGDGHITKAEIKRVLAMVVDPKHFEIGKETLNQFQAVDLDVTKKTSLQRTATQAHLRNLSIWIGDCMVTADWDDDGQIDYEEFLRALHPRYNEDPVTPKALQTPSAVDPNDDTPKRFFQSSVGTGINYGNQIREEIQQEMMQDCQENIEMNKTGYELFTEKLMQSQKTLEVNGNGAI
eukprot:CAMPEP_0202710608 /NCGR_PEP_ID=MMETSP1385-20130828/22566_1 /ASSEMBLY_ACC=CAM_ASM_000861 /TAXON_ID=933848 /ORGANISM="Elphidium margaritaceum" /LENGTH=1085 /DNA_ID=CAMNT_0049370179 /DNA_START=85 /DNA_END=3342 /DNA_ORIENTATION=+